MFRPLLRFGSTGSQVQELQQALNAGDSLLPTLTVDGIFGPKTHARVKEFQSAEGVAPDGVVGPLTWEALIQLLEKVKNAGLGFPAAQGSEEEARKRIVDLARFEFSAFRWGSSEQPGLLNPHIASDLCADPLTRARQGGAHLAQIFLVAGVPNAIRCATITPKAEQMYVKYSHNPPASVRNATDIPDWCGIFALYLYKMAGLNVSPWGLTGLRNNVTWPKKSEAEFRILSLPKEMPRPGDIGVLDGKGGRNHHFVVLSSQGQAYEHIDGNDLLGVISTGVRSLASFHPKAGDYFLTPIWAKVL